MSENKQKTSIIIKKRGLTSHDAETLSEALKDIPLFWEDFFLTQKEYLKSISDKIGKFSRPKPYYVFECYHMTSLQSVRVVIIGQDPYPSFIDKEPVATGMAFSQSKVHGMSRSMRNIVKELKENYPGIKINHNDLSKWARQGVFLLNASLTLTDSKNESKNLHLKLWAPFISATLCEIYKANPNTIFVAWGKDSQKVLKESGVGGEHLTAGHPSPVNTSGGFLGCKHFSKINELIKKHDMGKEIDWSLP